MLFFFKKKKKKKKKGGLLWINWEVFSDGFKVTDCSIAWLELPNWILTLTSKGIGDLKKKKF